MRFALVLLLSIPAFAANVNPAWKFKVLNSPHFELIYREDQKDLAKRYLQAAEQAHELLFPLFKESPSSTIIFLNDGTDSANGTANFLPYPHITVYPVLPSTMDSVDEYGDWILEMMIHEYTHILNMYPAHGFYVPLKYIFGSVVRPNALLPRWYLEGLAVNLESRLTDHGRLRSTETQASARALILGNRIKGEDVASMNEGSGTTWPYGSRPYLYGGWWWANIHREQGTPVIERWNQSYSRRLPFFLNGPMFETTQKSVHELVNLTADTLDSQGRKELEFIRASGAHESVNVAEAKGEQSVFALSPSGTHLVYALSRPGSGSDMRIKTRAIAKQPFHELKSQRLFKTVGTLKLRWLNEQSFVYDKIDIYYPYASYRDIYIYDLITKKHDRLTLQGRAQEASPSPSGKLIAFIQNDGGRNRMVLFDRTSRTSRSLMRSDFNQRLSGPEFISESEILFSLRQKSGIERLHVYNLGSGKSTVFDGTLTSAQNARRTSKGILVTDAGTRARNVYLVSAHSASAVSNTLTDIQGADFDPQREELVVSELTSQGRRLKAFSYATFKPPKLNAPDLGVAPQASAVTVSDEERDYQPLRYMLPQYWIPFIYQVEEGFIFQGLTANQDPAGRNQYSILGAYDTVTKEPSYGISYLNRSLPTDIGLDYYKSVSYLGASGITLETESAGVNFGNYWPFNTRHIRWNVGFDWDQIERTTTTYRRLGPDISWQYSRLDNPLNENWGVHFGLSHQEYIEQDDYLAYGRTYAHFATQYGLFEGHKIFLQGRGSVAPNLPNGTLLALGDRNVGGNYLVNLANSQFLLRGYPSGTFLGRKVVNANLEYILPAWSLDKGFGTFPVYLKNLELAAFFDTLAVDGAAFDLEQEVYDFSRLGEFYSGTGVELRMSTTTGYHMPLSVTAGLYYSLNDRFGGGLSPFFGIGFGGLSPLENKTP